MNWKKRVRECLSEGSGHKAFATRLSTDLGKTITPNQVKKYLSKMEPTAKKVNAISKKKRSPENYKWGTIYKILKNHFK